MSEPHSICAYNDCAIPRRCECVKRGYPFKDITRDTCRVPEINRVADELGWERPYPDKDLPDIIVALRARNATLHRALMLIVQRSNDCQETGHYCRPSGDGRCGCGLEVNQNIAAAELP